MQLHFEVVSAISFLKNSKKSSHISFSTEKLPSTSRVKKTIGNSPSKLVASTHFYIFSTLFDDRHGGSLVLVEIFVGS